jgi:malonyl-CoA/methylmalonyl-CoA synthetase
MTETVMVLSNPYEGERRPGSVGFELPGVHIKLANGDEGEISVRGGSTFHGYWRRRSANVEAFDDDGWFQTGDIARRDSDGYVSIVGRSKELIISGGFNVYPREIENVIEALEGVAECAVLGRPSTRWGEEVVALVVPARNGALNVAELEAWCRDRLVNYKVPKEYLFVDSLPRNHMGKVVRSELAAMI